MDGFIYRHRNPYAVKIYCRDVELSIYAVQKEVRAYYDVTLQATGIAFNLSLRHSGLEYK